MDGRIYAGVDVGTHSTKLVILRAGEPLATRIVLAQDPEMEAPDAALRTLVGETGLSWEEIAATVATGVGRNTVPFAQRTRSEQLCHAQGAYWHFPQARTVLDIGAEGVRAMRLNEKGEVQDFVCNSKCASGTGAFLEVISEVLEVPLGEMGELALRAPGREQDSSYCTVFAESEDISLIHRGRSIWSILAGVIQAVAERSFELLKKIGLRPPVVLTGGGSRNVGLQRALQEMAGQELWVPPTPQTIGALGAALWGAKGVRG
ncbi:MAG: 2-hydroxyglutaryl-CoA dehydratase [Candidatus Tectomicrobia bacterium]|uniref:2-hydroxyglutaryl-CoA dehydratase n=1 Tax=Tectimicrobiota bacterium TaxID=2528274 RepID=A0A932CS05_UNCTE|nr:2-hydroxyglutaryl-CoA dehydratase [Candidatus Tectomicrobia bacterium]